MSAYPCPYCAGPTSYRPFSGGREWYCESEACNADGSYPEDGEYVRANLLRTSGGRVALRAQMDQELARRREGEADA